MPALRGKKLAEEILRQADKLEGKFRTAYLRSVLKLADDKELKKLLDDIDKGRFSFGDSVDARLNNVRIDVAEMNEIARQAIAGSAKITNQVMGLKGSFDVVNDAVIDATRQLSIQLSTNLTKTAKESLRQIIEDQLSGNISRQEAVRRITMEVGLLPQHAKAVANYRKTLISAGTPRGQANRMAEQYAKRLLKYRANMIARTEVARATGIGQTNFWRQMRDQGALPPSTNRVWITAMDERACEFCRSMNGQVATIDGGWETPKGYMEYPQASHPHCRCSSGITTRRTTKTGKLGAISKVEELEYDHWVVKHLPNKHNQKKHANSKMKASTGKSAHSQSLKAIEKSDKQDLQKAVYLYSSVNNRYKKLNSDLRKSKGKTVNKDVKEIDAAFDEFGVTLEKTVTVYRGAVMPKRVIEQMRKAGTFTEHGFCSTTLSINTARAFSRAITPSNLSGEAPRGSKNVVFEVILPKGTRVMAGTHRSGREQELILPRGTKFRFSEKDDGTYVLEVIPK